MDLNEIYNIWTIILYIGVSNYMNIVPINHSVRRFSPWQRAGSRLVLSEACFEMRLSKKIGKEERERRCRCDNDCSGPSNFIY